MDQSEGLVIFFISNKADQLLTAERDDSSGETAVSVGGGVVG